ncbi:MAG: PLP-dependent cysteine synthase family protein [Bacteroidetes bacterium]|nr:PLP-dependent cysteine synthase family protein [Bacteroidota bacterium]
MNRVSSMLEAIGNTPLVQLRSVVPNEAADVYVKLEYYNPTGSYKDRMALSIVEEAEWRKDLVPGMTVVECTGGSTGTSLAFVCNAKGYRSLIVSSDAFAKEKLKAIRMFGADLQLIQSEGGKITPDLIPRMMKAAEELSAKPGHYWTRQFTNVDALKGYGIMGTEITEQLGSVPDFFVAAVGTAGMMGGVARALRKHGSVRVIGLEPASAPLLSAGQEGAHRIEGIGVGIVPPLLSSETFDEMRAIDESEAREMARRLVREEGILAGTSSGMNVAAAVALAKEIGPGKAVVTVACDSGYKYMAGDLFEV